jgi:cardiolipin synthase A/B
VNAAVCWLARQPHVAVVRTRNPAFRFDHRKLVVADGRLAWSGGRNFRDESFERDRDLSYTVAGPLAGELAEMFDAYWAEQGGRPAVPVPPPAAADAPNAVARVVRTRPTDREIARHLYRAVELARHHVYAENPYLGDARLVYLLARARSRGADVRVVLPADADSRLFDRSNRVVANRLLAAGCRVYVYPGVTHVKALAVDGVWAYTGTGNFDALSLRHNRELGLAVCDGPVIRELEERVFEAAFRPEWEQTRPVPVGPRDYLAELIAGVWG